MRDDRGKPLAHDSEGARIGPRLRRTRARVWATPSTPAALGKDTRQPLERFRRLLQSSGDLIRIGPVGGIQSIGQRVERLLSRGIRRAMRDSLANDRMPVREKRNAFVRRCPFDRRGNRRGGAAVAAAAGAAGRRDHRRRRGATPLTADAPVASSSRRGLRRRGSTAVSMTCWLSRTVAQLNGCRVLRLELPEHSGSSGSRPTRTPPGVRNMYRIFDR